MSSHSYRSLSRQSTDEKISGAFRTMMSEMSYETITVSDLTRRAGINRKTFYRHFSSLDDLRRHIQKQLADSYLQRIQGLRVPEDYEQIVREFFLEIESIGSFGERIICGDDCQYIRSCIERDVLNAAWSGFRSSSGSTELQQLLTSFVSGGIFAAYRKWVSDGRPVPVETVAACVGRLLVYGMRFLSPSL